MEAMFNSISWQQFFYILLTVLGAYYIISFLLLYSKEVIQKFKGKSGQPDSGTPEFKGLTNDLMGKIKKNQPNQHEQSIEADEINVALVSKQSQAIEGDDALLVGSVSDLLQEIKIVIKVTEESNGILDDVVPMISSLLSNYEQLINTKYQASISLFIHEQLQSEFASQTDLKAIESLWSHINSNK
jgi:hypothetical protein